MSNNQEAINQLRLKIEELERKQVIFTSELNQLKEQLFQASLVENTNQEVEVVQTNVKLETEKPLVEFNQNQAIEIKKKTNEPISVRTYAESKKQQKTNLEKFIGENLINKIGIAITILGVAIGTNYSIEHNLISPLTRVVLGYLLGLGLLVVGMKLKEKYQDYSAVLVSGSMAIMYFITYVAFDFYALFSQVVAFGLMVIFTIFTVLASLNYNKQIISLIGLVGAYAVPFLLSDGSGKIAILFSYVAIINIGILFISFKKYWKLLYFSAFGFTWLLFYSWYLSGYDNSLHFGLALFFLTFYFLLFYTTFLIYKLIKKEQYVPIDILLLLLNSTLFYSLGMMIISFDPTAYEYKGLFTLINGLIHFVVSSILYKKNFADRKLFYLVTAIVLVFVTLTIPIQLSGNWITLFWIAEAFILLWIGRTKNIVIYEKMSFPIIPLSFISLCYFWLNNYPSYYGFDDEETFISIINPQFLTSFVYLLFFGAINYVLISDKYSTTLNEKKPYLRFLKFSVPALFILTIYLAFSAELNAYFVQLYKDSCQYIYLDGDKFKTFISNNDIFKFKAIWNINYSLIFISALLFINYKKVKNQTLEQISVSISIFIIFIFLFKGLYVLSELSKDYLVQLKFERYPETIYYVVIRYISIVICLATLILNYVIVKKKYKQLKIYHLFELVMHTTILWLLSSELVNWMDLSQSKQSYKLGLSILCGLYSLFLISLGIWKNKQHLRIGAIVLFALILIKLFFYDIAYLDTIAKTIVFVLLGILLLIISFLYNKYKHIIARENEA